MLHPSNLNTNIAITRIYVSGTYILWTLRMFIAEWLRTWTLELEYICLKHSSTTNHLFKLWASMSLFVKQDIIESHRDAVRKQWLHKYQLLLMWEIKYCITTTRCQKTFLLFTSLSADFILTKQFLIIITCVQWKNVLAWRCESKHCSKDLSIFFKNATFSFYF